MFPLLSAVVKAARCTRIVCKICVFVDLGGRGMYKTYGGRKRGLRPLLGGASFLRFSSPLFPPRMVSSDNRKRAEYSFEREHSVSSMQFSDCAL